MKQYSTFIFDSYSFNPSEGKIELHYSLDDEVHFTETLTFPESIPFADYNERELTYALLGLHIIGGISYYKTCLPRKIECREFGLTTDGADFWNTVYENGLGEFFYKNDIDFDGIINFTVESPPIPGPKEDGKNLKKILVPIGGGKDSIVTIELLRNADVDLTLFRMGSHPLIDQCVQITGLPCITVERELSPTLFELNEQGALNGHVPITAYLSCLSVVTSILYGFDAVAMSNERSASEGNVTFHGKEINHQWSKSLEFEKMFQTYLRNFITRNVQYFSLLRPLSELHISKLFCRHSQYFECATSCNTNWRILKEKPTERWCSKCPKCAFAFCQFAAFLSKGQLVSIFGKNLFEEEPLLPIYKELLGLEGCKPFECVGTPDETKAAFALAHERGDLEETLAMKLFLDAKLDTAEAVKAALTPSEDHAMPESFLSLLNAYS